MSTQIDRISELAKEDPKRQFFSIAHLITPEALYAAFRGLRKKASAGVDGVTYQMYEKDAARNIQQLHERLKEGKYRAQPLRRVYIPKENGKERPISIPSLEDKIVQKATGEVLNAIYEQDFLECSYGFRPGRGPHQALDEVGRVICTKPTSWILELDITAYFDSIVRGQLMEMIEKRISDGSVLQLIRKWIQVGVIDEGRLLVSETGTGQGQTITPLTQKVTSNLNGWSQAGGRVLQCLTCVLRGNMFMTDGSFDESGQGSAVEHRSRPARAPYCVARGGAASVTGVRPIRASSIPVPGGSLPPRPAGRSHGGYGADHAQAPAEHSTSVAEVCEKQWPDYRSDRDTRVERVSRCSKKAWLSRAQGAARFKSTSTMRLIACASRNSPKPTIFWRPVGSAPLVGA